MSNQVEIREASSGGLGVFASTHLRHGELIVEEISFMVSTSHLPGNNLTWRDVMLDMRNDNLEARHVDEAMKDLSKETLDNFRATYADATSDLHRFQIVSYDICPVFGGPPSHFAATPVGPYMNHSCVGNLQYSWDEASRTVHLRAVEDIAPGDQLCLCYMVDDEWMDTETRKAELHLIYDFNCACPLCGNSSRSATSDTLREVIRPLQRKLKTFIQSGCPTTSAEEASENADRYVDCVEREIGGIDKTTGLPYHADVRLAAAYRLAAKCKQVASDSQRLRHKATEISRICFGPDSPHVAMQDRLFDEWYIIEPRQNSPPENVEVFSRLNLELSKRSSITNDQFL